MKYSAVYGRTHIFGLKHEYHTNPKDNGDENKTTQTPADRGGF